MNNQKWPYYIDSPLGIQINAISINRQQDNQYLIGMGSIDGRTNVSYLIKDNNG